MYVVNLHDYALWRERGQCEEREKLIVFFLSAVPAGRDAKLKQDGFVRVELLEWA
jgi:hypothetical protein